MLVLLARAFHGRLNLFHRPQTRRTTTATTTATIASLNHKSGATLTPDGNPMPRPAHVILPESLTRHRRVIIVGDIHGCAEELQTLLDCIFYRKSVDILISVGDLVNKGPLSPEVLKLVLSEEMYAVRGNHDDAAQAVFAQFQRDDRLQVPVGEKCSWVVDMDADLAAVLESMPLSLSLPAYNVQVVHAGMVPGRPVEDQLPEDLTKMRDLVPAPVLEALLSNQTTESESDAEVVESVNGKTSSPPAIPEFDWEACIAQAATAAAAHPLTQETNTNTLLSQLQASERRHPAGRAWASVWRGPTHVFFGHDAKRRLQVEPWATGVDGGCVYGGALIAAVLPPLDAHGQVMEVGKGVGLGPSSSVQEIVLGTGLKVCLVTVPALKVHAPPKIKVKPVAADGGVAAVVVDDDISSEAVLKSTE